MPDAVVGGSPGVFTYARAAPLSLPLAAPREQKQ